MVVLTEYVRDTLRAIAAMEAAAATVVTVRGATLDDALAVAVVSATSVREAGDADVTAIELIRDGVFAVPRSALAATHLVGEAAIRDFFTAASVVSAVQARAVAAAAFPSCLVAEAPALPPGAVLLISSGPSAEELVLRGLAPSSAAGAPQGACGLPALPRIASTHVVVATVCTPLMRWDAETLRSACTVPVPKQQQKEEEDAAPASVNAGICIFTAAFETLSEAVAQLRAELLAEANAAPRAMFWPPEMPIPLRVPQGEEAQHRRLHRMLHLPNRPIFRDSLTWRGAREGWSAAPTSGGPCVARHGARWEGWLVQTVHAQLAARRGLKTPPEDATLSVVRGAYDYYHYRVDGFEDDGWGCAYRSLQTLLSWMQYAGLVGCAVMPNVCNIQEILLDVDAEKQRMSKFVGSRTWIGSFEVMMVLQHFLPTLECTIKRLERGAELWESAEIKSLISRHFDAGGAPIMIGGSNFAHTILGIDWSPSTPAATQLLILDPHYSARTTDVKVVLAKGWCGWKDPAKFFCRDSWYNMCIPLTELGDFR